MNNDTAKKWHYWSWISKKHKHGFWLVHNVQWGLEYRTCSDFGWLSVFGSWSQLFKIQTMASLGHFIYKEKIYRYIKWPRLAIVPILNGQEHSKTELSTIWKPNFKMFGFRMCSVLECLEFKPTLYSTL